MLGFIGRMKWKAALTGLPPYSGLALKRCTRMCVLGALFFASAESYPQVDDTVNSAASDSAKAVLAFLGSLGGDSDRVLAGQNVGHANHGLEEGYEKYFVGLQKATQMTPSILGIDYGYEDISLPKLQAANELLIAHAEKAGLVTLSMSPGNPWTGKGLRDRSLGNHLYKDVVTPGTAAFERWRATLDVVAAGLAELRDHDVVVLWRPFHEMNGDFFWWSAGEDDGWADPEGFSLLWQDMFHYFSKEKRLDNLLWVYAPNYQSNEGVKPVDYYYPGGEFVDIVGLDYYENTLDYLDKNDSYTRLVALDKPVALTEVGPAFWLFAHPRGKFDTRSVIDSIRTSYPRITYFVFWQGWSTWVIDIKMGMVDNLHPEALLADPWVIIREDLQRSPIYP